MVSVDDELQDTIVSLLVSLPPDQRPGLGLRLPRWTRAVLVGAMVGAWIDSLIFLTVAFGSLAFLPVQVIGTAYGIIVASLLIAVRRRSSRTRILAAGCHPVSGHIPATPAAPLPHSAELPGGKNLRD
jgi:hypothetical protein